MSEKNLPPSHQRIRQAREKGQIGVSQDIVKLAKFAVIAELVFGADVMIRTHFADSFVVATRNMGASMGIRLEAVLQTVVPLLVLSLAVSFLAALLAYVTTLLQTGFNIASKAFENGPQKLNPISNLKQIFSLQKVTMLLLGIVKLSAVLLVAYSHIKDMFPMMMQLYQVSPGELWGVTVAVFKRIERASCMVLLVLAILDFAMQRWMTYRKLRMDIQELKRDHKESEGDPHVKSHRSHEGKKMLNEPNSPKLKPAAVVVNPEHIAIALAYDFKPGSMPQILAKGHHGNALDLRLMATNMGIPVVKYVGLARQLYSTGHIGQRVPRDLLRAVALFFHAVQEIQEKERSWLGVRDHVFELDEELSSQMLQR